MKLFRKFEYYSLRERKKIIMYKIQDIFIKPFVGNELITHMYYRGNNFIYENEKKESVIKKGGRFDFFTYFNSLSYEKWNKYTNAESFYLVLNGRGQFELNIFGHFYNKECIEKEYIGHYSYDIADNQVITIPFPSNLKSQVIGFEIAVMKKTVISEMYYAVDVDEKNIRNPYIALTTTTFKKEDYIKRNIGILNNELFSDEEYSSHFCWNIIDNGRTLNKQKDLKQNIRIFHNKNVGGAGGFARGMIEGLTQNKKPTHILLMDDDVCFYAESFKRLYKLLSIIKEEYIDYFVSGAMLKMNAPNIQHEDIGVLNEKGYHEALKPNLDLNLWDSVLRNEKIDKEDNHKYAAWWFCCVPTTVASLDNLPLPVFVRGDDVEYSLRNDAKIISMNGICIWHDGFEGKFSAALEYYQVERNELIITAMNPQLKDVDVFGHIEELFWQEVYKFNYKGASLLLDAVEDFLKGPDFFSSIDLFEKLSEKRKLDNQLKKVTDEVRQLIDYGTLFIYEEVSSKKKFIYDYSYNGQARIPNFLLMKKIGVIPYGWGYFPSKQCLVNEIYAIDVASDKYVVYKKDIDKFRSIRKRFISLKRQYENERSSIEESYQNACKKVSNVEFWNEYLYEEP